MKDAQQTWIALLRAIGPVTHKAMPLSKLCESCAAAGLNQVLSYIATGNLIFSSGLSERVIRRRIMEAIAGFGLNNEVFLRSPADLDSTIARNPFPDAARERPGKLLVCFMDEEVEHARLEDYRGRERFKAIGQELYVDYTDGVGTSKLTPAIIERKIGQRGTSRNWNTVVKLAKLGHGRSTP
jgi:uncharacterized protein (DUF1697 family)